MQTTKEVNPHPRIAPCVNMCSVTFLFLFFFLCHLLECRCMHTSLCLGNTKWNGPHHTIKMLYSVVSHSVTCHSNSIASRIHINTTKFCNITHTLIATGVILRSLKCNFLSLSYLGTTSQPTDDSFRD